MNDNNRLKILKESFQENFGDTNNTKIVRAPGRVNLIGEHTDYNEGFVMPVAIDRDILIIGRKRNDKKIKLYSVDFNEFKEFDLNNLVENFDKPRIKHWSNYPAGVLYFLKKEGYDINGIECVISGNIPVGASLSSSAAFEVVTAFTAKLLYSIQISDIDLIKLAQKSENEYVGVKCGIMDQFISCVGKKGTALFLDCRNLQYEFVPLNIEGYKIVIFDTKKKRELVESAYNKRRNECEEGVEILGRFIPGIKALRDVTSQDFLKYKKYLSSDTAKRVEHVVFENERVERVKKLLAISDLTSLGKELNNSHISLRDLYEVSCFELDLLVETTLSMEGVLGSRMTGAGFGGCAISLIKEGSMDKVCNYTKEVYKSKTGIDPDIYICNSSDGVGEIK